MHPPDSARAIMSRGIEVIASAVPAQAVSWYPVSSRGEDLPGSLIAINQSLLGNAKRERQEYVARYRRDDPFAPRHFLDSRRPLWTMRDIGGQRGLRATLYGSELLPKFGVEYEAALYIRDAGRMLGSVRIERTAEEGDLGDRDLDFLLRAQLFLEGSYVAALTQSPHPERLEDLAASGLTPREIEVARLAAHGDTNLRIAHRLVLAEQTVKTHLSRVFKKLDVHTRMELAARLASEND